MVQANRPSPRHSPGTPATVRLPGRARLRTLFFLVVGAPALTACGGGETESRGAASSTASSAGAVAPVQVGPVAVRRPSAEPNPLGLPARNLDVAVGSTVFTVPERMLAGAKLGSSLALRSAKVEGRDGENVVIDGRDGPSYKVHPAYVVPLVAGKRPRLEAPVIAEWAGALRHGVVRKYVKDKVVVRFTDTDDPSDRTLSLEQLMTQVDGFHPGNYALHREGPDYRHVLLVSAPGDGKEDPSRAWLCLGFAGQTQIVPESELVPVPVSYSPKSGASVWAEHLGRMRRGVVADVDRPGLVTIRFERAGRPVVKGWGLVMAPVRP